MTILTITQFAKAANVTPSMVDAWIVKRMPGVIRRGAAVTIDADIAMAWVRRGCVPDSTMPTIGKIEPRADAANEPVGDGGELQPAELLGLDRAGLAGLAAQEPGESGLTPGAITRLKELSQIQYRAMKTDEQMGRLLSRAEVEVAWGELVGVAIQHLEGLPTRLSRIIAGMARLPEDRFRVVEGKLREAGVASEVQRFVRDQMEPSPELASDIRDVAAKMIARVCGELSRSPSAPVEESDEAAVGA